MISHRLDLALHETIQEHAQRYRDDVLDVQDILTALSKVTASYLAELHGREEREAEFKTFFLATAKLTNTKCKGQPIAGGITS